MTTALVALTSSIAGFAARATLGSVDVTSTVVTAVAAAAGTAVARRIAATRLFAGGLKKVAGMLFWAIAAKIVWGLLFSLWES